MARKSKFSSLVEHIYLLFACGLSLVQPPVQQLSLQIMRSMPAPLLGTLGWPFQASPSAYSFNEKSSALVPIHPFPSAEDVHEFLKLYCSDHETLVVSPYTSESHTLDLNTLETPQQLMAKALTLMASLRPDYALAPYSEAFNWSTVINALDVLVKEQKFTWTSQEFYIIVFRSQLAPTADYLLLGEMDERSHVEATKSGGLLKYWFGEPDADGHNLATCNL